MAMKEISVKLPKHFNYEAQDVLEYLACKMYEDAKLSLGHAAELAGYTKKEFIPILAKYNVSVFNYPATDLYQDVKNA